MGMITFFNAKSIYVGFDQKEFNRIRDELDQRKIKYKYKVKNRMGQWAGKGTLRGRTGSVGTPSGLADEYEIRIHKKDYDRYRAVVKSNTPRK